MGPILIGGAAAAESVVSLEGAGVESCEGVEDVDGGGYDCLLLLGAFLRCMAKMMDSLVKCLWQGENEAPDACSQVFRGVSGCSEWMIDCVIWEWYSMICSEGIPLFENAWEVSFESWLRRYVPNSRRVYIHTKTWDADMLRRSVKFNLS